MRRFAVTLVFLALAPPVVAGYATRDAWIAVVGHSTGAAGRHFETTIYVTPSSHDETDVTLAFYPASQENKSAPREITLHVAAGQTAAVDLGSQLTGDAGAIGALHIRSVHPVVAEAHLYSHLENQPRSAEVGEIVNAIPAEYAIAAGNTTFVHVPSGTRYKLYAAETNGYPLYFSVTSGTSERRLLLGAHGERSWDLAELLPGAQPATVTVTGVNGSGSIVVVGTAIAEQSQDFNVYEMAIPARARHRMTWPEMTAYAAVAFAIGATAFYRAKSGA